MKRVAFLTMDSLADFVCYDHLAIPPLAQLGWSVSEVSWHSRNVNWNQFEAVVIRSPWDYQSQSEAFLQTLEEIASSTILLNSLEIVRWNIRKTYLRDLQERGISIVPTRWFDTFGQLNPETIHDDLETDEIVVKPLIGANADFAYRLIRDRTTSNWQAAEGHYQSRPFLAQPFVRSIQTTGEISLFYFAGQYSHAILKMPAAGDFRVQEEHGGQLQAWEPETDFRKLADEVMCQLPERTLYARVDLVRLDSGPPAVMEVELIEPSLYFPYDPDSPARFANAFARMMENISTP